MKKLLLTASSGGHFEQISILKKSLDKLYDVYVITEKSMYSAEDERTVYVKQINRKSVSFPIVYLQNRRIIKRALRDIDPDVVISTGALATISVCKIAKQMKKKVIFIESFAKIDTPTMTGKYVYKFADVFIVQWPTMLKEYPDAKYFGGGIY